MFTLISAAVFCSCVEWNFTLALEWHFHSFTLREHVAAPLCFEYKYPSRPWSDYNVYIEIKRYEKNVVVLIQCIEWPTVSYKFPDMLDWQKILTIKILAIKILAIKPINHSRQQSAMLLTLVFGQFTLYWWRDDFTLVTQIRCIEWVGGVTVAIRCLKALE